MEAGPERIACEVLFWGPLSYAVRCRSPSTIPGQSGTRGTTEFANLPSVTDVREFAFDSTICRMEGPYALPGVDRQNASM